MYLGGCSSSSSPTSVEYLCSWDTRGLQLPPVQGAFLGLLLFIIIFNGALLRAAVLRPHSLNLKYVDDLSMLTAINLRCLSVDQISRQKPQKYNERTQQVLTTERNNLQEDLNILNTFVSQKLMKIKESKTQNNEIQLYQKFGLPSLADDRWFSK